MVEILANVNAKLVTIFQVLRAKSVTVDNFTRPQLKLVLTVDQDVQSAPMKRPVIYVNLVKYQMDLVGVKIKQRLRVLKYMILINVQEKRNAITKNGQPVISTFK